MLTTPARTRGIIDTDPFRSSTLSIMKIATIDVNAIVIYMIVFHMSEIYKFYTAHVKDNLYHTAN